MATEFPNDDNNFKMDDFETGDGWKQNALGVAQHVSDPNAGVEKVHNDVAFGAAATEKKHGGDAVVD